MTRLDINDMDTPFRVLVAFCGLGMLVGPLGLIVSLVGLMYHPRRLAVSGVILAFLWVALFLWVAFLFVSF